MAWHGVEFSELGSLEGLEYMIPLISLLLCTVALEGVVHTHVGISNV